MAKIFVPAILCLFFLKRPQRFALCVTATIFACIAFTKLAVVQQPQEEGQSFAQIERAKGPLYQGRNFFGVKRVRVNKQETFHLFEHGTIAHGLQALHPPLDAQPTGYYHPSGPVGDAFSALSWKEGNQDVAVVGLGIGSMAAYARQGQHFVFFEIDPEVIKIAETPEYFTCLKKCRGTYEVVLGDGRLALARLDRKFGLIMLDAFNSDSVPVHLLSTEAVGSYLTKLTDGGILLFNISNRYLGLRPLMGALAGEAGLVCYCRIDEVVSAEQRDEGKRSSIFVVMARRVEDLEQLPGKKGWRRLEPDPAVPAWTDQYSNLLSVWGQVRSE